MALPSAAAAAAADGQQGRTHGVVLPPFFCVLSSAVTWARNLREK